MNEYFGLNVDEVQEAITSMGNMIMLKRIETGLGNSNMEYIFDNYKCIPTRRDFDFESYNSIEYSSLAELFLDAIFGKDYDIENVCIDEDREFYDELYFNFRVHSEQRIYKEKEFDDLCQHYNILTLKSDSIKKAIKIADGNTTILNNILYYARLTELNIGELEDYATINLQENQIEILLGSYSLYDLESSAEEFFQLEMYCREVVNNEQS